MFQKVASAPDRAATATLVPLRPHRAGRPSGWPAVLPMVLGTLGWMAAGDAWACRCVARQTSQHYETADRVVVGKVVSVREARVDENHQWVPRRVVFRVDEVFKGDVGRELVIENNFSSCDLRLQQTDRALLFLGKGAPVDACSGSEVFYSDNEFQRSVGVSKSEVARRRAHMRARIEALRALAPRKWWQVWR